MDKDYLLLKRAALSRPSGQWSDDDFDVLADGAVVGRTLNVHAAPVGTPWTWTLAFGHQKRPGPRNIFAAYVLTERSPWGFCVSSLRVPETPPGQPPLECDTLGRGSRWRTKPRNSFRRGNAGIGDFREKASRHRSEHSPLRKRMAVQTKARGSGTPLPGRVNEAACASNTPMHFAVTATTSRARLQRRVRKSSGTVLEEKIVASR